jgi:hypothetical protein
MGDLGPLSFISTQPFAFLLEHPMLPWSTRSIALGPSLAIFLTGGTGTVTFQRKKFVEWDTLEIAHCIGLSLAFRAKNGLLLSMAY